jgi:hypothetical protein
VQNFAERIYMSCHAIAQAPGGATGLQPVMLFVQGMKEHIASGFSTLVQGNFVDPTRTFRQATQIAMQVEHNSSYLRTMRINGDAEMTAMIAMLQHNPNLLKYVSSGGQHPPQPPSQCTPCWLHPSPTAEPQQQQQQRKPHQMLLTAGDQLSEDSAPCIHCLGRGKVTLHAGIHCRINQRNQQQSQQQQ